MTEELKPCPLCGCDMTLVDHMSFMLFAAHGKHADWCVFSRSTIGDPTFDPRIIHPSDFATAWNTRSCWNFDMDSAPKDGTIILGWLRDDLEKFDPDNIRNLELWNGAVFQMKNPWGSYDSDFGWSVALPVGHGGFPDAWFVGWKYIDLPTPPEQSR